MMMNTVCNLSYIYDKAGGYEYSLPKSELERFLSGKAFDNPEIYSEDESLRLHADIKDLFQRILSSNPRKANLAVITAGAPGAGKTFKMRQELEAHRAFGRSYAYICPDDVCLQNQTRTYLADVKKGDGSKESRQAAYKLKGH